MTSGGPLLGVGHGRRPEPESLLDRVSAAFVARPGASLGELAAAARVSRTTLHHAIGGRRQVVTAVGNHAVDVCGAALRAAVEQAPDPEPV
ncbi:MAG TPA: hypothetical protein VH573_19865, partial [Mycobacteriales bacterium]